MKGGGKQRHRKLKAHRQGLQAVQKVESGHSAKARTENGKLPLFSANMGIP